MWSRRRLESQVRIQVLGVGGLALQVGPQFSEEESRVSAQDWGNRSPKSSVTTIKFYFSQVFQPRPDAMSFIHFLAHPLLACKFLAAGKGGEVHTRAGLFLGKRAPDGDTGSCL